MDLSVLGFEVLSRGFHQCEQLTAHEIERSGMVLGDKILSWSSGSTTTVR